MEAEQLDIDVSKLFSTYGFITAERILEKYHIKLPQGVLSTAIKNPFTFYYRILQIPIKNVLNGIVLQQASDYHVYAQKLFIDYLLSGESAKGEETQGALTRQNLEEERKKLVELGDEFHQLQTHHHSVIASSQKALINLSQEWHRLHKNTVNSLLADLKSIDPRVDIHLVQHALNDVIVQCDLRNVVAGTNQYWFIDRLNETLKCSLTPEMKDKLKIHLSDLINFSNSFEDNIKDHREATRKIAPQARSYRNKFYDTILKIIELFRLLPEYKIDLQQDLINREPLYFDKTIGGV